MKQDHKFQEEFKEKTRREVEHYKKYKGLKELFRIKLKEDSLRFLGLKDKGELEEKYKEDKSLNNIPLIRFDMLTASLQTFHPNTRLSLSLAEGVCLYKHCLIYDVLDVTPPK